MIKEIISGTLSKKDAVKEAKAFLKLHKKSMPDEYNKAYSELSESQQELVRKIAYDNKRKQMNKIFESATLMLDDKKEYLSPSGKYKLVVIPYSTGQNTWQYSTGTVENASGKPLFLVSRNYSSFPYCWIENHPNRHSYLVCGEDHQGQTVLELDTGKRVNYLPMDAHWGWGFCWASMRFDVESKMLVADGCLWACPYEYRFYDFSDPMNGWPQIGEDLNIDAYDKWPEINGNIIKCFQMEGDCDSCICGGPSDKCTSEQCEEQEKNKKVSAILTYERNGNELKLIDEWISEEEKERQRIYKEKEEKYQKWLKNFEATDPLYLAYKELLITTKNISPEKYDWRGITYPGWCPDFDKTEKRMGRRLIFNEKYNIDLSWAVETGPSELTPT